MRTGENMRMITCIFICLLAGCARLPPIVMPPQIVTVTHTRYVPIPAALLEPCPMPPGPLKVTGDLITYAMNAQAYLMFCNQQIEKIKKESGTEINGSKTGD